MSYRKNVFSFVLAVASLPTAFATSGFTPVAGDRGFEVHASEQGGKTRAEVQKETREFFKNPLSMQNNIMGGDRGYVFPSASYSFQNGKLIRTDNLSPVSR